MAIKKQAKTLEKDKSLKSWIRNAACSNRGAKETGKILKQLGI